MVGTTEAAFDAEKDSKDLSEIETVDVLEFRMDSRKVYVTDPVGIAEISNNGDVVVDLVDNSKDND